MMMMMMMMINKAGRSRGLHSNPRLRQNTHEAIAIPWSNGHSGSLVGRLEVNYVIIKSDMRQSALFACSSQAKNKK